MTLPPLFEKEVSTEVNKYYTDLKKAFEVKKLPIFFYVSGNFPEFLKTITPQILINLKNPAFKKLVLEIDNCLLQLFKEYKFSEKFDLIFKESAKIYKNEIELLLTLNIRTSLFLYAIREAIKGMALGLKKIPYSYKSKQDNTSISQEGRIDLKELTEKSIPFIGREGLKLELKEKKITTKSTQLMLTFYDFLKRAEEVFKDETKKNSFVFYRLGIERLFLNFLELLPEKINIDYKILYERLKKYKNYDKFIAALLEDFPIVYAHKLFLLLLLKKLSYSP